MKQTVYSFKYSNVLSEVQATLLRVSDALALQYSYVFNERGYIKSHAYIHDQNTGNPNNLYLQPVAKDLMKYQQWLVENHIHSKWLFPSSENDKHIDGRQFYRITQKVNELTI